jgi:uncharacterized protein YuzE
MRLSYDQESDALYVRLVDGERVARTEQLDRGTLVDLDRLGRVLGIEILKPTRPWPLSDIVERFDVPEASALERFFGDPAHGSRYPFGNSPFVEASSG